MTVAPLPGDARNPGTEDRLGIVRVVAPSRELDVACTEMV